MSSAAWSGFGLAVCLTLLSACSPVDSTQQTGAPPAAPHVEETIFAIGTSGAGIADDSSDVRYGVYFSTTDQSPVTLTPADVKGASIGAVAGDAQMAEQNADLSFVPASVAKIITAAVALKTLGPDFQFQTEVRWLTRSGESDGVAYNLTVIADGDPQVDRSNKATPSSRAQIAKLVSELKAHGVKRIVGPIQLVSKDRRLDIARPGDGTTAKDRRSCYGAVAQSFNYRSNCAVLSVRGPESGGWVEDTVQFPIRIEIKPGERTGILTYPQFDDLGRVLSYTIKGTWHPEFTKSLAVSLPISNSKAWYGNVLAKELRQKGIDISKAGLKLNEDFEIDADPSSGLSADLVQSSFVIRSDFASDLVRYMNKSSDNFVADALFMSVASRESSANEDLRELGIRQIHAAVEEWLRKSGHAEYISEIQLFDGSGLSRFNRATPRALMALLRQLTKEPTFIHVWNSLPIAGVDGTLASRMTRTIAKGEVRAKTGTLAGAYQLAGYIPRRDSVTREITEFVPFVILSSTTEANRYRVRLFQDNLVVKLVELVNPHMAQSLDVAPGQVSKVKSKQLPEQKENTGHQVSASLR